MMRFEWRNLDFETRRLMQAEFESDVANGHVYTSRRAVPGSERVYFDAQRAAFASGDADSLNADLMASGIFAAFQSDGKTVNVADAAKALGDGQFVAYYTRAICRRALNEGREIRIYRGEITMEQRPESQMIEGSHPDAAFLLDELRTHSLEPWRFTAVGKVNSGLTVELL